MRKLSKIMLALGLVMVMSMPVMSLTMAAPRTNVAKVMDNERGDLDLTLLAPVEGRTFWYGGAAMPVRVMLTEHDDGTSVVGANITLWVNGTAGVPRIKGMTTNVFVDMGDGMYMFILDTRPYPAGPGSPTFKFDIVANAPDDRSVGITVELMLH